ncbi:hypothetical protein P3F83_17765 [Mycobacteroides immunogenum]|uniref:hypothetical protein n=1 Tax=Mycobacteroides immunogenum TaxID=83262 RepID=UPI0025B7469F|nr:hypothetical protein [Mycobacteroides immunogenum]WJR32361.1 hypothetical protein P3F83_17765 [Mycobacteroides immunogenum]
MLLLNIIRRYGGLALFLVTALNVAAAINVAHADPGPTVPPPPPVIGPLQYGPPGYPAAVGVPLLPAARSGVSVSADALSPVAPTPATPNASGGISGVRTSADALSPGAASASRP